MFISILLVAIFPKFKKVIFLFFVCIFHIIHFSKAPCVCLGIHQHYAGVGSTEGPACPECWGLVMLGGVCCSSLLSLFIWMHFQVMVKRMVFWWEICSRQISNVCWKDLGITLCWLLLFPRTLTFVVSCMLQHIMLIAGLSQAFSMSKCSVLWSFCFFQDGESVFFVCFGFGVGWFCVGFCLFIFVGCIFGCYLKY